MEDYLVTLTDDHGSVLYKMPRSHVAQFIQGINWENVREFTVEPAKIKGVSQWEIDLLTHRAIEVGYPNSQEDSNEESDQNILG